jgi:hypothetical protein
VLIMCRRLEITVGGSCAFQLSFLSIKHLVL